MTCSLKCTAQMGIFFGHSRDVTKASLQSILEAPSLVPKRFSLSPKACAGVLRRASKRGRELPPELKAALQASAQMSESPAPSAESAVGTTPP